MTQTFREAEEGWLTRQKRIENLWLHNVGADSQSPVGTAYAHNAPNSQALALSNTSILLELATKNFLKSMENSNFFNEDPSKKRVRRQNIHYDYFRMPESDYKTVVARQSNDLNQFDVSQFVQQPRVPQCNINEEKLPCDAQTQYRTFSGWCNNLRNPTWGKSLTTFDRMLPPAYKDGVSSPRSTSVLGGDLPSPRYISSTVHVDVSHLSQRHTLMMMQFGQFLDHDITHTPVNKGPSDNILNCRDCESYVHTHPECWPINVPQGDSYYPHMNTSSGRPYCIPFTRSLPGQQRLGPRDQINQNSAYVDSSHIYGETLCKANALRAPGGKLNATFNPAQGAKILMPQISHLRECKSPSGYCFFAGDPRASEQPALASVHTIFLRAHNHLADDLHSINPHWDEDRLYHQTRRLMGAMFQHVTYNEFLPRLLGAKMINAYGLGLQSEGHYMGYDPYCSANAYNEFATAAFRFGHSMIRPNLARVDNRYNGMVPHIALRDGFFNSDMLYKPLMVDEIVRGLLAEPMEQLDPFVTNEITNHLFEDKRRQFSGLDLIAINNHRGRDHGLPGYNNYRAVCDLRRVTTFEELGNEIPQEVIVRLKHVYKSVDDIDLFTGSLVEKAVPGGLVGPTMACIIGTQFKRLRQCDRFWYESNDPATRFTDHQLSEIRKMTLSKILCDNFDVSSDIQKAALDAPHNILNPRIPCDRLPRLNLEAWREPPGRTPVVSPAPVVSLVSPVSVPSPARLSKRCNIGGRQLELGESALPSPCVSCICSPEGAKCASLRIINCAKLLQEANYEEVRRDKICARQCGYLLSAQASLTSPAQQNYIYKNDIEDRGRLGRLG
ncbi:unnamed protein product [Allacma fusca]|uniref:Peroxidasin n=1 Tax=Allacma fusca TaxID=39272 RepID=A0A8J2NZX9_9HEXA|nr:unnamed protein product [Allacma fusca]